MAVGHVSCIADLDADEQKEESKGAGRPAWMIHVQQTTAAWLKSLPKVRSEMRWLIGRGFRSVDFANDETHVGEHQRSSISMRGARGELRG